MLVAYNIPHRDCGQYSSGGAANDDAYRSFVGQMAHGLAGSRAIVILEPDALAQTLAKCPDEQGSREALLAGAVKTLSGAGGEVYLDAGNPGFVTDTGRLAAGLRNYAIDQAAGFALNVSNFQTNDAVAAYGTKLSDQLGGKKFVIDTSRNGNGPYHGPEQPNWCNPPTARWAPTDPRHRRPPRRGVPMGQAARRLRRRLPRRTARRDVHARLCARAREGHQEPLTDGRNSGHPGRTTLLPPATNHGPRTPAAEAPEWGCGAARSGCLSHRGVCGGSR